MTESSCSVTYHIDKFSLLNGNCLIIVGWIFGKKQISMLILEAISHNKFPLKKINLPSSDVAVHHGDRANFCRFDECVEIEPNTNLEQFRFLVFFNDGSYATTEYVEPTFFLQGKGEIFEKFMLLCCNEHRNTILEIGARARSGTSRRNLFEKYEYTGFDYYSGPNVDVVGDAHELSKYFLPSQFDAIFSISTFEHLLMPWKVVLEINKIVRNNGLVYIQTHPCWPLHDTPWDFFRFSDKSWHGLFNKYTGFEIIETAMHEPASIFAHYTHSIVKHLDMQPAYLTTSVLCRKTCETAIEWDVPFSEIVKGVYPKGELALK